MGCLYYLNNLSSICFILQSPLNVKISKIYQGCLDALYMHVCTNVAFKAKRFLESTSDVMVFMASEVPMWLGPKI